MSDKSKSVDKKVVEMVFDNKDFERNVSTSMNTIDKLKEKLKFHNTSQEFEKLTQYANKVNFDGILNSCEKIEGRVSYMHGVIQHQIDNLVDGAVNKVKQVANTFTLEPITTGFQEYELKMGSVQTIMASTGASLDEVNGYLAELNTYSDKTIYSFSDMTNNIGKFTNAGVKLEDAVAAIKGVSNEAAVSGANAQEASRAMYNFAQALSAGYVKLIDWKSIENANMATVEFKNQLLETAEALGTVVKEGNMYKTVTKDANGKTSDLFNATRNFNEALSNQWMTTEVLTQTLAKYADETTDIGKKAYAAAQDVKTFSMMMDTLKEAAQSGWAETWELMIGDFNGAKSMFTQLSEFFGDMIAKSADARNSILRGAFGSGWKQFEAEIKNVGITIDEFNEKLKETGEEKGINIDYFVERYGSLEEAFSKGYLKGNLLAETLQRVAKAGNNSGNITKMTARKLKELNTVLDDTAAGKLGKEDELIKNLSDKGYDYAMIQELMAKKQKDGTITIDKLTAAQKKNLGITVQNEKAYQKLAEQAEKTGTPLNELLNSMDKKSGRELIIDSMFNTLRAAEKVINTIKSAWNDVFPAADVDKLHSLTESLEEFTKNLILTDEQADKLRRGFKGVFAIVDMVYKMFKTGINFVLGKTNETLDKTNLSFLDLIAIMGDGLVNFRNWVFENNRWINALKSIGAFFEPLVDFVKQLLSSFIDLDQVSDVFDRIQNGELNVLEAGKQMLNVFNSSKIGKMLSVPKKLVKTFGDAIRNFTDTIGITKKDKDKAVSVGENLIEGVGQGMELAIGPIRDVLKAVVDSVGSLLGHVSLSNVLNIILLFDAVKTFINFLKGTSGVLGPISALGNILEKGATILNTFKKKIIPTFASIGKSASFSLKMDGIKSIAEGILMLSGAVFLLCQIPEGDLKRGMTALGILAGGLVGMAYLFTKIGEVEVSVKGNVKKIATITKAVLYIAIAVKLMSSSLKQLSQLSWGEIGKGLVGLIGVCAVVVGIILALAKISDTYRKGRLMKDIGKTILEIGIAIALLAHVIKTIGKMSWGQLAKGTVGLAALGTFVVLLVKFLSGDKATKIKAVGKTILAISVSMVLLTKVIKAIGNMSWSEIGKGVVGLAALGTFIVLLIKFLSGDKATKIKAVGGTILALSIAMGVLTACVKTLGGMELWELTKGVIAVGVLGAMMAAMIDFLAKDRGGKLLSVGGTMVALSVALGVMSLCVKLLGGMDLASLSKGVIAMGLLGAIVVAITRFAKGSVLQIGSLITMIGLIVAVGGSLALLSLLDTGKAKDAAEAMAIVLGALVIAMNNLKGVKVKLKTVLEMIAIVTALGIVLGLMSFLHVENSMGNAVGLSVLLGALVAAFKVLATVTTVWVECGDVLKLFGEIILAIAGLAAILWAMSALNVQNGIENAVALSILLGTMTGVIFVLSKINPNIGAAAKGALAIDAVIGIIGGFMAAIGFLVKEHPEIKTFVSESIPLLESIAEGIGGFFGTLLASFYEKGILEPIKETGKAIDEFMDDAKSFTDKAKTIDKGSVDGVKTLAECMLTLAGSNFVSKITSFKGMKGVAESFKETVPVLADAVVLFGNKIKDANVDSKLLTNAANVGKAISEMAKSIPSTGGLKNLFTGKKDLEGFSAGITAYGEAIKSFRDVVAGDDPITQDDVNVMNLSIGAADAMVNLNKTLAKSDGLVQKVLGEQDLEKFSGALKPLGEGIVNFAKAVTAGGVNLDSDNITKAVEVANSITSIKMESLGGVIQAIGGEKNLGTFAENVSALGTGIVTFASIVNMNGSYLSSGLIDTAIDIANKLSNLSQGLKGTNIFQQLFGSDGMTTFSNGMQLLGNGVAAFSNQTASVNAESMTAATDVIIKIANMSKSIDKDTGDKLKSLSKGMKALGEVDYKELVEAMSIGGEQSESIGVEFMNSLIEGITSTINRVKDAMSIVCKKMLSTISDSEPDIEDSGCQLAIRLLAGFLEQYNSDSYDTISSAMNNACETIATFNESFFSRGADLGLSLAEGLRSKIQEVAKASAELGQAAESGLRGAVQVHSPSRVFNSIGGWCGVGLSDGLESNVDMVRNSSEKLGRAGVDTLTKMMAKASDIVQNGDITPTIRPVLDTTGISEGMTDINQMMNSVNAPIGANTNAITNSFNRMRNNESNKEVISAINKLGEQLGNTSSNVYNIDGITYDDGSNVSEAVGTLVKAVKNKKRT